MARIKLPTVAMPISPNPGSGRFYIGFNSSNLNHLTIQDSTGALVDLQSGASYTNEDAQDAVGSILTDTASVDMTYDDVLNTISAVVIPGGVNHNALQNFVANQHIDHSAVSILTPGADGLQGGGDLTASRTLGLSVNTMTPRIFPGANFELPGYSPTLSAHRKVTRAMLLACDTDLAYQFQADFITGPLEGLTSTITGTGASTQAGTYGISVAEQARGVSQSDTGTTTTGRAALNTAATNQMFVSSADTMRLGIRLAVEALSNPTDTFLIFAGFGNGMQAAGVGTNFIGFRYTDAVNSGRYEAVVKLGGIDQFVGDTAFTVPIDYAVLEIRLNGLTNVEFLINGTLTNTFNYSSAPTVADTFGFGAKIEKTVGTAQRNMSLDWLCFDLIRSTGR